MWNGEMGSPQKPQTDRYKHENITEPKLVKTNGGRGQENVALSFLAVKAEKGADG